MTYPGRENYQVIVDELKVIKNYYKSTYDWNIDLHVTIFPEGTVRLKVDDIGVFSAHINTMDAESLRRAVQTYYGNNVDKYYLEEIIDALETPKCITSKKLKLMYEALMGELKWIQHLEF